MRQFIVNALTIAAGIVIATLVLAVIGLVAFTFGGFIWALAHS